MGSRVWLGGLGQGGVRSGVPAPCHELRGALGTSLSPLWVSKCSPLVSLSYADTLPPATWGWDLVWKQGLYRYSQVMMRSFGWTLISSGWCPYRKNRDTQRRQLCEDGGRDWSGAATCRGHWSHQKLEQARQDPLSSFQRAFSGPAGLVASTPVKSMAALASHRLWYFLQQPRATRTARLWACPSNLSFITSLSCLTCQ